MLATSLGIMPCHALGILEALWHTTAELAPEGNIGRLPNRAIAMEMFYEGDPEELISALVKSGHLDQHDAHRLIVHDWLQHSDYNTKRKVERRGRLMIANDGSEQVMTRHKSIPEPEPEPEPVPEPVKKPLASTAVAVPASPAFITFLLLAGKTHIVTEADVAAWAQAYPAVDVRLELRKAFTWLDANPTKRSATINGSKQRIVRWLGRSQDQGGTRGSQNSQPPGTRPMTAVEKLERANA